MSFNPDLCYDCGTNDEEHTFEFDSHDNYLMACPIPVIREN